MLYARVTQQFNQVYLPRGAELNKWYRVNEGYCWFPSGHRFGYRFVDFNGCFIKAENVEVCIVGEKVNKIDHSLTEFIEIEEICYR